MNLDTSASEEDLSDLPEVLLSTELDAIVKYDETYHRDGRALIYYERAVLITTYQHGYKNGIGYILYDDEMISIVEFQNDCAISCTKVESTITTVTNTELHLSFDGQVMDGVPMGFGVEEPGGADGCGFQVCAGRRQEGEPAVHGEGEAAVVSVP